MSEQIDNGELNTEKTDHAKRIFLNNLPKTLTRAGLRNLCQQFGKVEGVHWMDDRSYAFVEFETET